MKACPRCKRYHSGLCGIPPQVTLHRPVRRKDVEENPYIVQSRRHGSRPGLGLAGEWRVDALLDEQRQLEQKIKALPLNSADFDDLYPQLDGQLLLIQQEISTLIGQRARSASPKSKHKKETA